MSADALTAESLSRYLHAQIPLARAMQVSVVTLDPDELVLGAPLAPNINHRDTLFGGSASAVCILAAWSLLHARLRAADTACRLVIQRNTMDYDTPVDGAFTARAALAAPAQWGRFLQTLHRRGRARVDVTASLEQADRPAGRFRGTFVTLRAHERDGEPGKERVTR